MKNLVYDDLAPGYIPRLARLLSSQQHLVVILLALFLCILGIGMVIPLLPVFAKDMGAGGIWLGLVFSGFAFSQIPLMPLVGRLSDKHGKKFFIWCGLLVYVSTALGYFWSPGYHELAIFSVLSGVGAAMLMPTAASYIGALAPFGYEGRYMGMFNAALLAGFGIGPVLGGVIHDRLGMDATFISMGILSALSFFIVFFWLPGKTPSSDAATSPGETRPEAPASSFTTILKDATMQGVTAFVLLYDLLFGSVLAFIGVWMTTVIETSVAQVGILLTARYAMTGTLTYPFGWLADRSNRVALASAGMLIVVIGTLIIPWLDSFAQLLGLFVLMGMFESMIFPSATALAVEKGRNLGMGSIMGVFNMSMSLGFVTGAMVGGVIESSLGLAAVFRSAAVYGLVGIIVFNVLMRRSHRLSRAKAALLQPGIADPTPD